MTMETTIAQKLVHLKELQSIDTALYDIAKLRGALPDDLRSLEDSIAGLETRKQKTEEESKETALLIATKRNIIKDAESFISKCDEQQENVRNNREYDSITKQIELKQLEIALEQKRIKEAEVADKLLVDRIKEVEELLLSKRSNLEAKRKELDVLVKESEAREGVLHEERVVVLKKMEDYLKLSYQRLLDKAGNGLAVVSVRKDACGGCFSIVPPQRQVSIREGRKIVVCEHCGRILVDVEIMQEPVKTRGRKRRKQSAA